MFLRHIQKRGCGVPVILALEHAFAKPELGVRRHLIARIFLEEGAERFLGERVVLPEQIAIAEVVLVTRRLRRRQGCGRTGCIGIARRRRRQRPASRRERWIAHRRSRHGGQIQRSARLPATGSPDILFRVGNDRGWASGRHRTHRSQRIARPPRAAGVDTASRRAQRARHSWRTRVEGWIKRVAAPCTNSRWRCGGRERSGGRERTAGARRNHRLLARAALLLHAPQLAFQLLIAKLQLLDLARELTHLIFKLIEANNQIGSGHLGGCRTCRTATERGERKSAESSCHGALPENRVMMSNVTCASRRNCDFRSRRSRRGSAGVPIRRSQTRATPSHASFGTHQISRGRRRRGRRSQRRYDQSGAPRLPDAAASAPYHCSRPASGRAC